MAIPSVMQPWYSWMQTFLVSSWILTALSSDDPAGQTDASSMTQSWSVRHKLKGAMLYTGRMQLSQN